MGSCIIFFISQMFFKEHILLLITKEKVFTTIYNIKQESEYKMVCYDYDPVKVYNDGKNKGEKKRKQFIARCWNGQFPPPAPLVSKWCLGKKGREGGIIHE